MDYTANDLCICQKYIGVVYLLGGGIGLLASMLLDTKMRFENIRSFDINGTGQFLADELHKKELLQDWRFKANTQDLFDINYIENEFQTRFAEWKTFQHLTKRYQVLLLIVVLVI